MERLARKGWTKGGAPAPDKRAPVFAKNKLRHLPPKEPGRESKPKAKFMATVKSSSSTGKVLEKNSFLRPSKTQAAAPPKIRAGFSLKTFSSKAKEVKSKAKDVKKPSTTSTQRKAPLSFATTQPVKFLSGAAKKSSLLASMNPQHEGGPPKPRKGGLLLQLNDTLLRKRSLTDQTIDASPVPKKMKQQQLGWTRLAGVKSATKAVELPTEPAQDSIPPIVEVPAKPVSELSPVHDSVSDVVKECDAENCDDPAIHVSVDEAKEQDFLDRAGAIQRFTDGLAIERKQLHSRLIDTHADLSECLLDAMTGLLAEEGGIGIDKLDVDVNVDVDAGELATVLEDCAI